MEIPKLIVELVDGYKKTAWAQDHFAITSDGKYDLWFYNVDEYAMGSYAGHLSICYSEHSNSPLLSSSKIWVQYSADETFSYARQSDCIIFRMPVYQEEMNKTDYPYLLIKPGNKCFALIEWDFTSIYYFLEEVAQNTIIVKEGSPKELDRVGFKRRTGEEINLRDLKWYDFAEFSDAKEIYLNRYLS